MQVGQLQRTGLHRIEQTAERKTVIVELFFDRGALDARVTFNDSGDLIGLRFAPRSGVAASAPVPAYADSTMFLERAVVVGSGDWVLPGTLSVPRAPGSAPAVVLVHGSGPHDRDETLGSRKPFRDIAWGLASRGIAVLRYDKRTLVHASKFGAIADSLTVAEETMDDAILGIDVLVSAMGIDPRRVFLLGHSLGGMLAPRIGLRDCRIAGLIIMAGPSRPLEDVILDQTIFLAELDGTVSALESQQLHDLREQIARVKRLDLSRSTPAIELPLGLPASYWLDLREYDPAKAAVRFGRPLLLLHGGRDHQVRDMDLRIWRSELRRSSDVQFREYPKLGHTFAESAEDSASAASGANVSREVIEDIAAWIWSVTASQTSKETPYQRESTCTVSRSPAIPGFGWRDLPAQ